MTDPHIRKDKERLRDRSAGKPFVEKLQILEKLRDRNRSIRSARPGTPSKATPAKEK